MTSRILYPRVCVMIAGIALLFACSEKKEIDPRFSTPTATYEIWLNTAMKGDLAESMECITMASQRFVDSQANLRDEFIKRMAQSAKVFRNYSVEGEKITGDKGILVIIESKSGVAVSVPFLRERGEWKVDLVAMFRG